ncbi:hypothetical protein M514_20298 [Trichuris suis]|uniref:Uncharacterized protein n=1 Tax=Trichuris suis TaxID=68888 RepID=A0A085NDB1_9BILA|nr:hypothetical protein M514_20298 [Trichuris suis]
MQYAEVTYLIAYKVSGTEEEEEASANDQECYCKGNEMKVRVTSFSYFFAIYNFFFFALAKREIFQALSSESQFSYTSSGVTE